MSFQLYGMASPNVTKIRLMLEELGWPYTFHRVRVFREEQFSESFRRISPNGKVPVLIEEDAGDGQPHSIAESGAILLYLAERSGQFLSSEIKKRYEGMQWLMIQLTGIGPMFGQHTHFKFFAPPGNDYALQRYTREVQRYYRLLDARLADVPYLAGETYSIADINAYPWVSLHARQDMDLEQVPHVLRWFQTVGQRPAVLRTQALTAKVTAEDAEDLATASAENMRRFLNQP